MALPLGPAWSKTAALGTMGVAADDDVDALLAGIAAGAVLDLLAQAAEADMGPVEPLWPLAVLGQPALGEGVGMGEEGRGPGVGRDERVEPVAVQGHERAPVILPAKRLGGLDAHQLGHEVRQMAIVIAQHPDDLGLAPLAKVADMREQMPGVGTEVAKAPVVKDVAQEDQALEPPLLEQA